MIHADPNVKMDQCHLDLIYGLLVSHKPGKVLELGMGSGVATDVILRAFRYNGLPLDLTCVDNWLDWQGKKPQDVAQYEAAGVKVITAGEKEFVFSCSEKFDFIVSDADHDHAQDWFDRTLSLLRPGGVLIYHDVTNPDFRNLYSIYLSAKNANLSHFLFNTSSREEEKCERGLLIIQSGVHLRRPPSSFLRQLVRKITQKIRAWTGR